VPTLNLTSYGSLQDVLINLPDIKAAGLIGRKIDLQIDNTLPNQLTQNVYVDNVL